MLYRLHARQKRHSPSPGCRAGQAGREGHVHVSSRLGVLARLDSRGAGGCPCQAPCETGRPWHRNC